MLLHASSPHFFMVKSIHAQKYFYKSTTLIIEMQLDQNLNICTFLKSFKH